MECVARWSDAGLIIMSPIMSPLIVGTIAGLIHDWIYGKPDAKIPFEIAPRA